MKPVDEDVVVSQTGALPNAYMCSDHIPLVSEFQFIKPGAKLGFADSAASSGSWRRDPTSLSSAATRHADDEADYDSEDEGLEESDDASSTGSAGSSRSGGGGSRGGSGVYAPWATHSSHSHSHRGSNGHDDYWSNDSDSDT